VDLELDSNRLVIERPDARYGIPAVAEKSTGVE
jgi:hypothetical protein